MSLYSAVRGLWWVASEVVDAAKQLCGLRPDEHSGHVHVAVGADRLAEYQRMYDKAADAAGKRAGRDFADGLAEYEAGVECLEAQDDCGLGGPVTVTGPEHATEWLCVDPRLSVDPTMEIFNERLLRLELAVAELSSAAPGVSPVEAADSGPGVTPHSPPPGSPASLPADELDDAARACHGMSVGAHGFPWGELSWDELADKLIAAAAGVRSGAALGNDPASVHDRAMRQRHNEDREQ